MFYLWQITIYVTRDNYRINFKQIPWSLIMSEMPAENKQTKMEAKSLNQIITPILIGAVADVLISQLEALPPSMRLFSIILLGLVYGWITNSIGVKNLPISRRAGIHSYHPFPLWRRSDSAGVLHPKPRYAANCRIAGLASRHDPQPLAG